MAKYKMNQTGVNSRLSSGIRADYAAAQRKAEAIGDRYTVRGDVGVNLTEWDTTGMAAPAEYKNLRRTAPDETTTYGFKQVAVNGRLRNVLIVNPFRYLSEGKHADMVASTRSLASALGLRIGFIAGQTSETTGRGKNRRDTVIDADFLLTNDDRVFINLDSEIPYTEIVAMAWWKQFRATNPRAAANMERLAERTNALTGDDRIAQDYVVDLLTRKGSPSLKALQMSPDRLVMALSDRESAAYAYAHKNPGIMRKLFENAGDMIARFAKEQDYRAAYISGQLQARLMKAFSESDPNRPGGVIEDVKAKSLPEGVWFMYAGEKARTADHAALAQAKSMIDSGTDPEIVRQETGWFKGMDGKWRFEIDDSNAQYYRAGDARFSRMHADYARHQTLLNKMLNGQISPEEHAELRDLDEIWGRERGRLNERVDRGNATLDEILDHEALFEAYPELRNVKVRFGNMSDGARGEYDYKTNTIKLSSDLRDAPEDTLLHEIQHAVQEGEGFARGASEDYWKQQRAEIDEILAGARNNLNLWLNDIGYKEQLQKSIDEVVKKKKSLDQHWKDMEAFKANSKYARQIAASEAEIAEYVRQRKEITGGLTAYEQYLNTAGEIEARDTAARRSLSSEQRKNTRPDVDRTDVVFAGSYLKANQTGYDPEAASIKEQIVHSADKLNSMNVVAEKTVPEDLKGASNTRKWVLSVLANTGYRVDRQNFGTIHFNADDIGHGLTYASRPEEKAAFAVLPQVLKRGIIIGGHTQHKGRNKDTVTIAAPVKLNGVRGNMAVTVSTRSGNHYDAHRIVMPDGSLFVFGKKTDAESRTAKEITQRSDFSIPIDSTSNKTIPQPTDEVKFSARRDNNATFSEPTRKTTDSVDTYKRRDLRARISKEVKALSAALVTPSDKKHIPPKLTAAIADFLKEFTNDTSVFTAGKLAVLREAYDRLSDTGADADMDISYAYDPDISATISELSDTIDGRRLAQLSLDETVKVKNIVQHFKHLVSSENAIFLDGRRQMVAGLGMSAMSELARRPAAKDAPSEMRAVQAFKDMLTSGNLTPVYFFKRIGGTIQRLFKTVLNAQNTWARNMQDARQVYESAFRKYHADRWMDKRGDTLSFTTERGDDITLTRQQALTLYATYKREETNQIQEAGHLRLGGFVYEDAVKTKRGKSSVDTSKAHPLSAGDMVKIIDWLTDEQIQFADELVGYMSGDLAKLGNETSMQLHGWEKFTESYYFPYNSAENYLYTKQAVTEDRRLKHMSFTKSTIRRANNPIVLSDFTQVWAGHVQNMLLYSSLAVPLENFNRVYNYKTSVTEDSTSRSVKEELERAYGKRANRYISQLLTDINGGVQPNPSETLVGAMLSKFKKSAVFASASVVVQQPSAIGRAMALIDPKYFVQSTLQRKNWEECKRHCGVALIKEMGRFDTGTGRGAAEWLIAQPYKGAQKAAAFITDSAYRDEVLSAPAAKADAYTWAAIWNACKREAVKEKGLKPGSDELFKAAAERFDDVVNFTQVYDSVFSRSELMRSKGVGAQMLTSFMGEPTVSYNMLYDAIVNARRTDVENKVSVPRAVGAFLLTTALNAILKSLVTAARDDDEESTYIEKYLGELVENFTSDANVLNLIPYVRDVMSLIRGYSVENSAYEIPSMLIDAVDDLDNDKLTGKDKLRGIAEATAALFGVPLKNVLRDIDAAINTFFHTKPLEDTTGTGIINAVLDKLPGYDNARTANYGRLFDAYTSGDNERAEKILDRLGNAGADESDVLSGLRKEAKGRYLDGDITDAEAIQFLTEHGSLDENEAYWKLQEWTYEADNPGENFSKYNRLRNALDDEDYREAHDAAVELLEHGVAVRTLKSETSKHVGSSSILYRIGLADYLNADKEKPSGGSSGRSSGRSSGGSTAKAAAPESSSGTAFTSNEIDLPDFDAPTIRTIPRSASQNRRVKAPARQNIGTTGGVTETTAPSSSVTGIYNTGCDNYDNGTCRIGRTSCDGCRFATS